jgi:hypothetical protein
MERPAGVDQPGAISAGDFWNDAALKRVWVMKRCKIAGLGDKSGQSAKAATKSRACTNAVKKHALVLPISETVKMGLKHTRSLTPFRVRFYFSF